MSANWVENFNVNNTFGLYNFEDVSGGGSGGYYYDRENEVYRNGEGKEVSFDEYYDNKIAPDLSEAWAKFVSNKFAEAIADEESNDMASLAANVVFGIPSSDEGLFNRLATVNYLLSKATSHYIEELNGHCAENVFSALDFGNLCGTHSHAYLAGTYLMKLGFMPIKNLAGYSPSLCDITIFDSNPSHQWGHMEMWCGSEWVSDFRQGEECRFYPCFIAGGIGFSPYSEETTPTFTIYKRPWWLLH